MSVLDAVLLSIDHGRRSGAHTLTFDARLELDQLLDTEP
jgi:hypothetical protein